MVLMSATGTTKGLRPVQLKQLFTSGRVVLNVSINIGKLMPYGVGSHFRFMRQPHVYGGITTVAVVLSK